MSQASTETKVEIKDFITAYVKAQKDGKTVADLCTQLKIDAKQYASLRNRMTKVAEKNKIEIKPLTRKERSPNATANELAQILKDAFGEKSEESTESGQTENAEQTSAEQVAQ